MVWLFFPSFFLGCIWSDQNLSIGYHSPHVCSEQAFCVTSQIYAIISLVMRKTNIQKTTFKFAKFPIEVSTFNKKWRFWIFIWKEDALEGWKSFNSMLYWMLLHLNQRYQRGKWYLPRKLLTLLFDFGLKMEISTLASHVQALCCSTVASSAQASTGCYGGCCSPCKERQSFCYLLPYVLVAELHIQFHWLTAIIQNL